MGTPALQLVLPTGVRHRARALRYGGCCLAVVFEEGITSRPAPLMSLWPTSPRHTTNFMQLQDT